MQIGTVTERSETVVGSRNLFMVYCHVAHDCEIGDDCILASAATLAGHIRVENAAIIGGSSASTSSAGSGRWRSSGAARRWCRISPRT